jgi:tetratricopeptide (TPR) repeat protein
LGGKTESKLSQKKENQFATNFIEATTQKIIGNYELAEKLFLEGLKLKPKSAATYFELSGIYDYKKEGQMCIESAQKAVELNAENDWYKTNLAVLYQKYGLYQKSLELYKELVNKHPNRHEYLFTLAENYLILEQKEEALKVYDKIQEEIGNSEELAKYKQSLYLELGQIDNAILEIEKLVEENPANAAYYGLLAELYEEKGDAEKALKLYNKVLEIEPNNENIRFALYGYYKEKGQHEEAFEQLKKAFENPDASIETKIQILLGYLKTEHKEKKEQGKILADILTVAHPMDARSFTAVAEIYIQKEELEKALEAYKKSVKINPDQHLIWEQIVFLEADLQWYDSLIVDSEKALELYPTQPLYYFFSGLANLQKQEYDLAIDRLSVGKELIIDNQKMLAEFYQKIGDAYHAKKEHQYSDEHYDKALEINPSNPTLLNNYSYYLSERGEQLEKAEKMAQKANRLVPQNANFLDTYAWVLFKQKKYAEAEEQLDEALQYGGSNSAVILEHYGDVNFFLGKKATAIEYWNKAQEKGEGSQYLEEKIKTESYIEK